MVPMLCSLLPFYQKQGDLSRALVKRAFFLYKPILY